MDETLYIIQKDNKGKFTSESAINNYKIEIFSKKSLLNEVIFGGKVLNFVNDVARQVAINHSESNCYTIGIDFIRYYSTIKRQDSLICNSQINYIWEDIIEVGAKVIAEDLRSLEQRKILSAYFIFKCENKLVPKIIPETEQDKRRYSDAIKRRKIREKKSDI